MVRAVIVENDGKDRAFVTELTKEYFAQREIQAQLSVFRNGGEYCDSAPEDVDIVLMDIEMERMNGIETARRIRVQSEQTVIIFTTNMVQYALEGYSVHALDYLIKPLSRARFYDCMDAAMEEVKKKKPRLLQIDFDKTSEYVEVSSITYIETSGKKTMIHTVHGDRPCSDTMKTLEERLTDYGFYRCHQAFIVNMAYVECVTAREVIVSGQALAISRQKKADFMQELVKYTGKVL